MVSKLNDISISGCSIRLKNAECSSVAYSNSVLFSDFLVPVKYF